MKVCVRVCEHTGLTDQPDDIEGGVGEDRRVGLIQVVVGPLLAPYGLPGHAEEQRRKEGAEP